MRAADRSPSDIAEAADTVGFVRAPDEGRRAHSSGGAAAVLASADLDLLDAEAQATLFVPIRLGPRASAEARGREVSDPEEGRLCLHHDPVQGRAAGWNSYRLNFSICSAIQVDGNSGVPLVALASAFQPLEAIRDHAGPRSLFPEWSEASACK